MFVENKIKLLYNKKNRKGENMDRQYNGDMILIAKTFGCVRMVYNHWLDRKIRQYEENKTNVTYTICAKEMAEMKKTDGHTHFSSTKGFLKKIEAFNHRELIENLVK